MLSRRQFLKKCRNLSILMCGSSLLTRSLAEGFIRLAEDRPSLVFIHAQNCMGCTASMMYGNDFDFVDFLSGVVGLDQHPSLSFSQGDEYLEKLDRLAGRGDYLLVVEGSVPTNPREACYLGDRPLYDVLDKYVGRSRMVVSSGSCASHGGIPASNGNPTGAVSVNDYLKVKGLEVPLFHVPGCPAHPDHLMGSIAYIAATGKMPPMNEKVPLPREFFGETLHNQCNRFQYFTQDKFVEDFSRDKEGCLLKKGCRGPVTPSDCSVRRWNKRTSACVHSNTPCIGCMSSDWPFAGDFYLETEEVREIPWSELKKKNRFPFAK